MLKAVVNFAINAECLQSLLKNSNQLLKKKLHENYEKDSLKRKKLNIL